MYRGLEFEGVGSARWRLVTELAKSYAPALTYDLLPPTHKEAQVVANNYSGGPSQTIEDP